MKALVFFLLGYALVSSADGEEKPRYGWPLPFDNGVSSTFMEFRANHFHAGIDLRTYRMTGFPVLAISDGAIFQMRVVKNDTGRSLYLRHTDGNISTYYHLERFIAELEILAKSIQTSRGEKYFGYHTLEKPLTVARGDCIGFSGETGSGLPHLHVEIRSPQDEILNPFFLLDFPSIDPNPPLPKMLLLKTCQDSLIDGRCGEMAFPLVLHDGRYTLSRPLEVQGAFEPVLQVYDVTGVGKLSAPYAVRAYIDDRLVYDLRFDQFRRDDNNQLGFVYDVGFSTTGAFFFNLFSQPGFDLERAKVPLPQALASLPEGQHQLRVVMADPFANETEADIPFTKVSRSAAASTLESQGNPRDLHRREMGIYLNHDDIVVFFDVPWPLDRAWLVVEQGGMSRQVEPKAMKGGIYFTYKPLNRDPLMLLKLLFSGEKRVVAEIQERLILAVLTPEVGAAVSQRGFSVDFGPRSVREPKVVWLRQAEMPMDTDSLPVLMAPVHLSPFDIPFLDNAYVHFRMPGRVENPRQVGIFKYNQRRRRWNYLVTTLEESQFSARVISSGTFALLRDTFPPVIRLLSARRQALSACSQLTLRIRDHGKGIDESTLKVILNDVVLDNEYDPDRSWVKIAYPQPLRVGENLLQVEVADWAGNRSLKKFRLLLR